MTDEEKGRIVDLWNNWSEQVKEDPIPESDIVAFEKNYHPIPSDFRWFLTTCGSGMIPSEPYPCSDSGSLIDLCGLLVLESNIEPIYIGCGLDPIDDLFVFGYYHGANAAVIGLLPDGRVAAVGLFEDEGEILSKKWQIIADSFAGFMTESLSWRERED